MKVRHECLLSRRTICKNSLSYCCDTTALISSINTESADGMSFGRLTALWARLQGRNDIDNTSARMRMTYFAILRITAFYFTLTFLVYSPIINVLGILYPRVHRVGLLTLPAICFDANPPPDADEYFEYFEPGTSSEVLT